jgi:AcrR family transcriptional regulator
MPAPSPSPARQTAPNPRKRPKQARAQNTVAVILEAAARILEEQGLEAANTNAIAALAGISVGSLYQYFGSKDAILAELARSTELATADELEQASAAVAGLPFEAQARTLIHLAFGIIYARPQLGRILSYHEARMRKDEAFVSAGERMAETITRLLEQNRADHARRDCVTAARDVLGIVEGMALSANRRGEADIALLEQRVATAVLGYLTHPGPA